MSTQAYWIPALLAISVPFFMSSPEPMTVIQALDANGRAPFVDLEAWALTTKGAGETVLDPPARVESTREDDYLAWSDSSLKFE